VGHYLKIGLTYIQKFEHCHIKMLSASGGFAPDWGLCPWTPLGALPPDLRYLSTPQKKCNPSDAYGGADNRQWQYI